tara:strand:+ start:384 stop:611 length:228 start_codon:yes stop_codon:yes gene_type:complete
MNSKLKNSLTKMYKKQANDNFIEWLDKNVDDTTNKNVVNEFLIDIKNSLKKNGYKINDENQFKNEIATYIYKEST